MLFSSGDSRFILVIRKKGDLENGRSLRETS